MVQFQLQRRLRRAWRKRQLRAEQGYDDIGGVAQNWQDIAAERGRTSASATKL